MSVHDVQFIIKMEVRFQLSLLPDVQIFLEGCSVTARPASIFERQRSFPKRATSCTVIMKSETQWSLYSTSKCTTTNIPIDEFSLNVSYKDIYDHLHRFQYVISTFLHAALPLYWLQHVTKIQWRLKPMEFLNNGRTVPKQQYLYYKKWQYTYINYYMCSGVRQYCSPLQIFSSCFYSQQPRRKVCPTVKM